MLSRPSVDTNNDAVPELQFEVDVPADLYLNLFAAIDGADVILAAQLDDGSILGIPGTPF